MMRARCVIYNFLVTAGLLSLNWIIYVYVVKTEQFVDAALGYFIYPLCTVMQGIIFSVKHVTAGRQ